MSQFLKIKQGDLSGCQPIQPIRNYPITIDFSVLPNAWHPERSRTDSFHPVEKGVGK